MVETGSRKIAEARIGSLSGKLFPKDVQVDDESALCQRMISMTNKFWATVEVEFCYNICAVASISYYLTIINFVHFREAVLLSFSCTFFRKAGLSKTSINTKDGSS